MQVELKLYAMLRKYRPEGEAGESLFLDLENGATVAQLLEELGIPPEIPKAIFVNDLSKRPEHVLADGDRVGIFPPVAGG